MFEISDTRLPFLKGYLRRRRERQFYRNHVDRMSIIVASMGRCGSTMLYNLFVKYGFRETGFLCSFRDCFIYANGNVYKTHDTPPPFLASNVKVIYLFGNPMDIVISTNNKINWWGKMHHKHFGSGMFSENNDLFKSDTLQLHNHFESWYRQQKFRFLSIKYEALFSHEAREILGNYLGFEVQLPPYRERQSSWISHPRKKELIAVYGQLHEKVREAENVRVWTPSWKHEHKHICSKEK